MLKRSALVALLFLAGQGTASAQPARQPDLTTNRSVASQSAHGARADSARRDWAEHVISKFLDDDAPRGVPMD